MEKPNFPHELAVLKQWVCWRLEPDSSGRDAKVPYCPLSGKRASSGTPANWGTLSEAQLACDKYNYSGVGFMFTTESGIVGVDIDHCLDADGKPNETASAILSRIPHTYVEISPSGTGLHIFLYGAIPPGGNKNSKTGVEMYAHHRYFTMTGRRYSDCADIIAVDNGALEYIHETFIKTDRKKAAKSRNAPTIKLSDQELLDLAQKSKDKDRFGQLWQGDWSGQYKSQSEADFALCCKLAFWSGRNNEQIDRLFRQSGLFREKWDAPHHASGESYGESTVRRACETTDQCYSPPPKPEEDDTGIFEHNGRYYRARGDKVYPLTNFIIQPIEMITAEEDTQLTCDLVTTHGKIFRQTLMTSDFSNLQKFKNVLNKKTISLSYLGSESELELLKIHISDLDWVMKRGVKALGIYPRKKQLVFVSPAGAVAPGGKAVTDMLQLERFQVIESDILKYSLLDHDGMLQLGQWLMSYNEPAKAIPILAWVSGCFIKPHLRRLGIKFPHLFLIGEAGSGKSNTLERVILPVFSRTKVCAASQVTPFSIMKEGASSNIIPQALDEFKPSKLDKIRLNTLYNHFRDSYDWHEGIRGRADQSFVLYDLLAPIVVAGEESADETAIRERSIELLFSKRDLKTPGHKEAFAQLSAHGELLGSFGRSLLDAALQSKPSVIRSWYDEGMSLFSGTLPTRITSNLCCAYCGLCLAARVCNAVELPWDDVFPFDHEACAQQLEYSATEYLLDGGAHNKSVVEQTFEVLARMKLAEGKDYAFENNGQFLCLCLSSVYDRYTRYRKDYAVGGEILSYAQFRKQLEHCEFFVAKNKSKRMGDEVRKIWVVDFEVLQRICDVSGFTHHTEDVPSSGDDGI